MPPLGAGLISLVDTHAVIWSIVLYATPYDLPSLKSVYWYSFNDGCEPGLEIWYGGGVGNKSGT
jgi:hypothetical protein